MELSKTAYVILGMLGLGKSTGYDIKALVDVSTRFFWAASYGQIYPELRRLEAAGLIEGERESEHGRRRKSYRLTGEGRRALRDWLTSNEGLHDELRHEGVLKFFFADALTPDEQLALVRRIRAHHEALAAQLRQIQAVKEGEESDHRFPGLTLGWGIEYQERMAEWCAVTEQQLTEELARG
jgi:PadR family transcriptional regulator, regulatory protein AphA